MPVSADSKRALQGRIAELKALADKLSDEMQSLSDQRSTIQDKFLKLKAERDEYQRRIQAIRNDL